MAFDLNKNDGTQASSKFDLSKEKTLAPASNTKIWLIGIIGFLIVGGGILYYSTSTKTVDPQKGVSTQTLPQDSTGNETSTTTDPHFADPVTTVPAEGAVNNESKVAEALNHKVPVTFAQGSTVFESTDQKLIKSIVSFLTNNPGAKININGYASSDGSLALNQTIAQARADAFKKYLVSKNIEAQQLIASGRGIENPIASNETNEGRRKNRRIEITFSSN